MKKIKAGNKFKSIKTGNTLTIDSVMGNKMMVFSSDGSESMHSIEKFEFQVELGNYIDISMASPEQLAIEIKEVRAVELKKGFRIDAEMNDGSVVTLKKKSTRMPEKVQLYSGIANFNSSRSSIGKHFTFAKTIGTSLGYGGNHLKTFNVK